MKILKELKCDVYRYSYGNGNGSIFYFIFLILRSFSKFGFLALLNYRIGKELRRVSARVIFFKQLIWIITGISKMIVEILFGISLSYNSKLGKGMLIAHFSNIIVGDGVVIGDDCTLHQGVTIGVSGRNERGLPTIGNNFFAGANAVIVGSIIIEDNVVVAANSLVYKDVKLNSVVSSHRMYVINTRGSRGV
ncbi:serine O-acetyltransferase [Moritella sp. Urea-trap-13]|uniref:serine O-acetyltransferase n=1 Tax=Moritella sp. Urea-trap-13 TaxID=2058327 RepID=UPI000C331C04|nr:serine acetyltransferase [Moritella sp. Urea-trap-13]PKH05323.1 hypothetical protein CXF93_18730 [Moritella sp. Urea-trap-13]